MRLILGLIVIASLVLAQGPGWGVLPRLDTAGVDLTKPGVHRTDGDFAVSWVRSYGSGRVLVSTLGHTVQAWEHPVVQKMWVEAMPRPRPGR